MDTSHTTVQVSLREILEITAGYVTKNMAFYDHIYNAFVMYCQAAFYTLNILLPNLRL